MPFGLEGAKGLAEKIQPIVRFPILMRVILPGLLATTIVCPFTGLRTDFLSAELGDVWRELIIVLGMLFVFGALIAALSGEIYKIYEGRILWPQFLFDWFKAWQESRVRSLLKEAEEAERKNRAFQYNEIWYTLRRYPVDKKGDPQASHPTLLGNILAGYEDYPQTRYGMDSVFYWPRLWLEMDKDKKEEIDGTWSIADGFLSMSAVSFLGGILWIAAAVIKKSPIPFPYFPLESSFDMASVGAVLLAVGYLIYRLSLPFHRMNGEVFKAIFDLYRNKISAMTHVGPTEQTTWQGTWSYLQYLRVHCANCLKYFPANHERCKFCGFRTAESLEKLRRMADPNGPSEKKMGP